MIVETILSHFGDIVLTLFLAWVGYGVYRIAKIQYDRYKYFADVPGPRTWNLLSGHLADVMKMAPLEPHRRWYKKYRNHPNYKGVIVYQTVLGKPRLLILDPKLLQYILSAKAYTYVKPRDQLAGLREILGSEGVLVAEGKQHQRQRKLMNPVFNLKYLRNMVPIFVEFSQQLAQKWGKEVDSAEGKGTINIHEDATKATLDVIGSTAFEFDFFALRDNSTVMHDAYNTIMNFFGISNFMILRMLLPIVRYLPLENERRYQKAKHKVYDTVDSIIKERRKLNKEDQMVKGRDSLLSILIQEVKNQNASMTDVELRDNVLTFLAAGHETTAVALSWALLLLAENPQVQDKLRTSLADLPDEFSFDDINDQTYLNYVVNETLRVKSPVPATLRVATQDDFLNGIKVPAGTSMFLATSILQTDPQYWGEDADKYNPDRWASIQLTIDADTSEETTDDGKRKLSPYLFLPFIAGPRACIGRQFAILELKCLLTVLIKQFKFEVVEGEKVIPKLGITLRPTPRLLLKVSRV